VLVAASETIERVALVARNVDDSVGQQGPYGKGRADRSMKLHGCREGLIRGRIVELMHQAHQLAPNNVYVIGRGDANSHAVSRNAVDDQSDVVADNDLFTGSAAEY
jgi:hypothetical protein